MEPSQPQQSIERKMTDLAVRISLEEADARWGSFSERYPEVFSIESRRSFNYACVISILGSSKRYARSVVDRESEIGIDRKFSSFDFERFYENLLTLFTGNEEEEPSFDNTQTPTLYGRRPDLKDLVCGQAGAVEAIALVLVDKLKARDLTETEMHSVVKKHALRYSGAYFLYLFRGFENEFEVDPEDLMQDEALNEICEFSGAMIGVAVDSWWGALPKL